MNLRFRRLRRNGKIAIMHINHEEPLTPDQELAIKAVLAKELESEPSKEEKETACQPNEQ